MQRVLERLRIAHAGLNLIEGPLAERDLVVVGGEALVEGPLGNHAGTKALLRGNIS